MNFKNNFLKLKYENTNFHFFFTKKLVSIFMMFRITHLLHAIRYLINTVTVGVIINERCWLFKRMIKKNLFNFSCFYPGRVGSVITETSMFDYTQFWLNTHSVNHGNIQCFKRNNWLIDAVLYVCSRSAWRKHSVTWTWAVMSSSFSSPLISHTSVSQRLAMRAARM